MTDPTAVPSSINFAGSLLYDDKGNFIAVTSGSTFNVTQSYLPIIGQGDNGKALPLSIASGSQGLKVTAISARNVIGEYGAATALIPGVASSQNLFSIENPVGSGKGVVVKKMIVGGVVAATATTIFLYRMGRNNSFPTGGSTVTATKRESDDPNPIAVVRSGPTGSVTNTMWCNSPGVLVTAAGAFVSSVPAIIDSDNDFNDVLLSSGEAVIVIADTNTTNWRHFGYVYWQETT